jgi:hypothetical protein
MNNQFSLTVIFGKQAVNDFYNGYEITDNLLDGAINEFHFETLIELQSFILGLDAAIGWTEYTIKTIVNEDVS